MIETVHPLGTTRVLSRRRAIARIGGGAVGLAAIAGLTACGSPDDDSSFGPIEDAVPFALAPLITAATRSLPPVRAAAVAYMIGVGALTVIDSARRYFDDDEASDDEQTVSEVMATRGRFVLPVDSVYRKAGSVCWTAVQDIEPRSDQERNGCTAIVRDATRPVLLEGQALMALGAVTHAVAQEDGLTDGDTDALADLMFPVDNDGLLNVWLENGGDESRLPTASGDLVVTRVDGGDQTTDAEVLVTLPDGRQWNAPVPKLTHV